MRYPGSEVRFSDDLPDLVARVNAELSAAEELDAQDDAAEVESATADGAPEAEADDPAAEGPVFMDTGEGQGTSETG